MSERRGAGAGTVNQEGFTLIEVLVAFAIIALATVVMVRIGGETLSRGHHIESLDTLIDEAEGIVLLRAAAGTLHAGSEQGRFSDGRVWTLSVADAGPGLGWRNLPPLWRVRLLEGSAEGRTLYTTLLAGGLGGD